jgi:hypothetical protein
VSIRFCLYFFISIFSRIHKPLTNGSNFADAYANYKKYVANPMRSYSSLFFREKVSSLNFSQLTHGYIATAERSKWALPGTEESHNQQQELAALSYSRLAPFISSLRQLLLTLHLACLALRQPRHMLFQRQPPACSTARRSAVDKSATCLRKHPRRW